MADIIVVGSGASAVQAAWPLVQKGHRVRMLDAGRNEERYTGLIPEKDFETIRHTDEAQHRYFLGDEFEGIPFGSVRVGAQLTPPRAYIAKGPPSPAMAGLFQAMETMAVGGLAAGWGAATPPYTDDDMDGWPISRRDLQPYYESVGNRVGICGESDDDLAAFFGPSPYLLPAPRPDSNARKILHEYRRRRRELNRRGFYLGTPRLAMATRRFRGRGPLRYFDMEFWADKDRAVYRPVYTLDELKRYSNFEYIPGRLVLSFENKQGGGVSVDSIRLEGRERLRESCDRLVLAAGNLGTARLALHSLREYDVDVPLLSNPYTYYPCLVWKRLGRATRNRRHSLTQLMIYFNQPGLPLAQAQIYSYRSLLTFKLAKEAPLATRESIQLMRMLQPSFIIVGIHHEDRPAEGKTLTLRPPQEGETPSAFIEYRHEETERERIYTTEKRLMRCLRKLGCLPLRRIDPGYGSSIHYGGSLPMSEEERPLTTRTDGSLRGTEGVYIADASTFPHLPAKGLTFTAMANAERIGEAVASRLNQ